MNILGYQGVVEPLADHLGGGFVGYVPALKGCISDGESPEEATHNLEDAARGWLVTARNSGRGVPPVAVPGVRLYA